MQFSSEILQTVISPWDSIPEYLLKIYDAEFWKNETDRPIYVNMGGVKVAIQPNQVILIPTKYTSVIRARRMQLTALDFQTLSLNLLDANYSSENQDS